MKFIYTIAVIIVLCKFILKYGKELNCSHECTD